MKSPSFKGIVFLCGILICFCNAVHCAATDDTDDLDEEDFEMPAQNGTVSTTHSSSMTAVLVKGLLQEVLKDSPLKNLVMPIVNYFTQPGGLFGMRQKRQAPPLFYPLAFLRIIWQFINGIAKPYLKTYLVPIQLLFAYMTPRMILSDCFKVDTKPVLAGARTFAPFTIAPTPQKFLECTVDIITQFILVVKLMADMAASIF